MKLMLKLKELELKDDGMKYTDKNARDGWKLCYIS